MSETRKSMAQSRPDLLRVITYSRGDISNSYANVTDLLTKLCEPRLGAKSLVQTEENRTYIVSLIPIGETSLSNLQDAAKEATQYLASNYNSSYLALQFSIGTDAEKLAHSKSSHLLVISRYNKPIPTSEAYLYDDDDMEDIEMVNEKSRASRLTSWIPSRFRQRYTPLNNHSNREPFKRHLTTWVLISLLVLSIVVTASYGLRHFHPLGETPWMRYPTPRSEGPRYQLEFNHHNVSSWAAENPTASDEYYIRVDDGCMFAPHLVNEQELRYQKLLETRYPQLHDLRMQRKYLNEEFLSDPFAIQIKVDNAFHLGHCVIAIRRYWWARETGKHVCPKDLDFRHIRHCLDVFDSWVFPDEFPQHKHGQDGMAELAANETEPDESGWDMTKPAWFVWKQEVCF